MAGWEILYKWSFIAGKIIQRVIFRQASFMTPKAKLTRVLHILEVQLLFKTLPMSTLHSVPSFPGVSQCSMAFTAMTPERPTPVAMEISWHREPHVPSRMCSREDPWHVGSRGGNRNVYIRGARRGKIERGGDPKNSDNLYLLMGFGSN